MSETNARRVAVLRVFAKSKGLHLGDRLKVEVLADCIVDGEYIWPDELIPWVERIGESMPGSPMIAAWLRELQRQRELPQPPPLDHNPMDVANSDTKSHAAGNHAAGHSRPSRASRK